MFSKHEIEEAQAAWGAGVVAVGQAPSWQQAHGRAEQLVQAHYVLDGHLLFKPTKAAVHPFRRTQQAAVSYFVGRNQEYPEDQGFALEPWTAVRFVNVDVVCRGEVAMAMGNYFFARADGSEIKVEFSFVYVRDEQGIKIQLHHSALPFGD